MIRDIRKLAFLAFLSAVMLILVSCGSEQEPDPVTKIGSGVAPTASTKTQPAPSSATASSKSSKSERTKLLKYDAPPPMTIDLTKKYTAIFDVGADANSPIPKGGQFEIELFADDAPNTVNNFVFLAREGFYDGTTFHRVIQNFMAQGGDPTGSGSGGPGYRFESELTPNRRHDGPGVLSMANSGGINTNGSQFFITFRETGFLDGYNPDGSAKDCAAQGVSCHTVFGKVTKGLDIALKITVRDPSAAGAGDQIKSITIREE
jgi:cyclophilin family peptidyl-prolyl cis-trans isomerase